MGIFISIIPLLIIFITRQIVSFFQRNNKKVTHAGGVVINNRHKVLLVTAKNFSFIWVLPKGHIKKSEKEISAAFREIEEESGIKASIKSKLGNAQRLQWNFKKQTTAFYLMNFESISGENKECRKIIWLPVEEAIKKLYYKSQRDILKKLRNEPPAIGI